MIYNIGSSSRVYGGYHDFIILSRFQQNKKNLKITMLCKIFMKIFMQNKFTL